MKTQVPVVWLLANLFHPLLLITWFGVWDFGISSDDFGIVLMLFIYGFLFSMPSLLLGFLAAYLVSKMHPVPLTRFLYWLLLSPLVALLNWMLVALFFGGRIAWDDFSIALPAMIAVLLASLMRYKSFLKADIPTPIENNESETHL